LGKFVYPVGFAVAPGESNDVYVLDRVVSEAVAAPGVSKLQFRLQKLSSTGKPIASATLPLEEYVGREGALPLISLAVDSTRGRVYALVEGITTGGGTELVQVAQRLVAWSTKPQGAKGETLVKATAPAGTTEYAEDKATGAALIAGGSVLEPGEASKDLYSPQGLTVAAGSGDVVIEAQQGVGVEAQGGPTILQQVITEGSKSGQLGEHWVAGEEGEVAPAGQQGDGVFAAKNTSNEEVFGIDLYESEGSISRLADVHANFAAPDAALLAPDESAGKNRDQAPSLDNESTVNYHGQYNNELILKPYTAGSPITQLSNGLYAARYAHLGTGEEIDNQSLVEPWNGLPKAWYQGEIGTRSVANEGVRLFTSGGSVVTTIGGQAAPPCNIDTAAVSLAAGASESVFVLTQPNAENANSGDEVIEFAPGGKGACPQPSGNLTVNGKAGSSFSFPAGTNVTLADSVERKNEVPYRFDWVLLNAGTSEVEDLKTQIEAPTYKWPAPGTGHTFTKKGTYYLAATLYGDYGVIQVGGLVTIKIT
jgi:hypothetical protein